MPRHIHVSFRKQERILLLEAFAMAAQRDQLLADFAAAALTHE